MADDVNPKRHSADRPGRVITVCAACETEDCWQGRMFCDEASTAGTKEKRVMTNPTDAEVDAALASIGYPQEDYPDFGHFSLRAAYREGYENSELDQEREILALRARLKSVSDGRRELAHTFNHLCVTMQAAALDSEQSDPNQGMEWIRNTLVEAGMYPVTEGERYSDDDEDDANIVLDGETAQQFYDRQTAALRAERQEAGQ